MKKIFLSYDSKDNFGDDLAVKLICKYFSDVKFTTLIPKECGKGVEKISNLKIYNLTPKKAIKLFDKVISKSDVCISVDGTAFFEGDDLENFWNFKYDLQRNPVYFIGTSFGPHKTSGFLSESKNYISDCEAVMFRDEESCRLINNEKAKYVPDISFLTEFGEPLKANKPYVIISPVDLQGREELSMFNDTYMKTLKKTAEFFKKKGYDVIFFASCTYEWDDKVVDEFKNIGMTFKYYNNIDHVLSMIKGAKCVVGSRFRVIMTALAAGVQTIPICYNENLSNTIHAMDSAYPCFDIKNLSEITNESIEKSLNYKTTINPTEQKVKITNEFEKMHTFFCEK